MDCRKIAYLLAAGIIPGALSATIKVNDNLSFEGFIDMSGQYSSLPGMDDGLFSYGVDQYELDALYSFDKLSARADINAFGSDQVTLEQAYISYAMSDNLSFSAGKFLSYLGWEAAEPTGLYQYSYAYDLSTYAIPGYANGIKLDYTSDSIEAGVSLLDGLGAFNADHTLDIGTDYGLEGFIKFKPAEGLNIFIGAGHQSAAGAKDYDVFNIWASYEVGKATIAAEYNLMKNYPTAMPIDGQEGLIMVYFAATDTFGITGRVSYENWDELLGVSLDKMKYTVSPSFKIGEHLTLVTALSYISYDDKAYLGESDETDAAVELLFAF